MSAVLESPIALLGVTERQKSRLNAVHASVSLGASRGRKEKVCRQAMNNLSIRAEAPIISFRFQQGYHDRCKLAG